MNRGSDGDRFSARCGALRCRSCSQCSYCPCRASTGPARHVAAQETIEVVQLGLNQKNSNFPRQIVALFAESEPKTCRSRLGAAVGRQWEHTGPPEDRGGEHPGQPGLLRAGMGPRFPRRRRPGPDPPAGAEFLRPTDHDPNGLYYSWALSTPAFIYNKDQIAKPPKSYADLLNTEGRISYDNPVTSASGMIFMVGAILANSGPSKPEPGFEYLKKLRSKITAYRLLVASPVAGAEGRTRPGGPLQRGEPLQQVLRERAD